MIPAKRGRPVKIKNGDFMRVMHGPLAGAEGTVHSVSEKAMKKRKKLTIVEIRQLNGNPIRLPRSYFEFAATRPREVFDG